MGLGVHFELDYRDRVARLPSPVDEHGNTASIETAISGLNSYKRAKRVRKFGFVSFGIGAVLSICALSARREDEHTSS